MASFRQLILKGLFFLHLLKFVSADGHVNIQLEVLQYDNPKGTSFHGTNYTSQRKCCDSGRNALVCNKKDTCDPYFVICIGGIVHDVKQGDHCKGHSFRTKSLKDSDSFSVSPSNNLMESFQWNHWYSGDIKYVVNVMDDDSGNDELIEDFTSTRTLRVGTIYQNATLHMLSLSNFVSVDLGIRIWCQDGYGGPDCSNKCTNSSYSVCTYNGGSESLPSCLEADVSRLQFSGVLNYKAKSIQQLLSEFFLQNICPEAHSLHVDIVHFSLTGSVEFKATCNNTAVSSLVFTTHIFILSMTNKAALANNFPHISIQVPSVTKKRSSGAHMFMIVRILNYKDLSSACNHHACNIQISVCIQGLSNSCLFATSNLNATELAICDGNIVDLRSTPQGRSTTTFIPMASWPVFNVNVKYNNQLKWQKSNNVLHSYEAETLYNQSASHRMTIQSSDRKQRLVIEMLIWCAQRYSGNHCQHQCRSTTNQVCNKDGHLVCRRGYHGSSCLDENECSNKNSCKNGGTCHNTRGSFTCTCPTGWTGQTCEVDIDECEFGYCLNASKCSNGPGSYHSRCASGFGGLGCTDINECNAGSEMCHNGGTCLNIYGSYTCRCAEGFTGHNCEQDIDECSLPACQLNHTSSCHNTVGGYSCTCRSGWTGNTCDNDIDECRNNHCVHGSCSNTPGNYTCNCLVGYAGRHCEHDFDECSVVKCANNGTCVNLPYPKRYRCDCLAGWDTNSRCRHHNDQCQMFHPCVHGSCTNKYGQYVCTCDSGWTGRNCSVCSSGWTGTNCSVDINECTQYQPCLNRGICQNTAGGYICNCLHEWSGKNCSVDVSECNEYSPCLNNATCRNTQGGYTCHCPQGWTGSNCSVDINECNEYSPCLNNATCRNTQGGYTCHCLQGWTGSNCSVDIHECNEYSPCLYNEVISDSGTSAGPFLSASTASQIKSSVQSTTPNIISTISTKGKTATLSTHTTSLYDTLLTHTGTTVSTTKPYDTTSRTSSNSNTTQDKTLPETTSRLETTTATSEISNSSTEIATASSKYSFSTTVGINDAIFPSCTSSGWNVTMNMSVLHQLYPGITSSHIYFGGNSCRGRVIGNLLVFQQGFRDCLTSERISGDTIFYENDLYYAIYDPVNPFIIRQHKWTYTVECDVSRNEVTSSHVHHDIDAHHIAVSGHYNISMAFFKDPGYMQKIPGNPIHTNVGDNIYVKVFTSASDWSVKMRLHTCYTKPTEDADRMIFYIIKDGCEVDSNTHIISQSTHETRFVFQDFEYSTNKEGLNIYCNATFCESQDYTPGCAQSCQTHGSQVLVGK